MRHLLRSLAAVSLTVFLAAGPCATRFAEAQTAAANGAPVSGSVVDQQTGLALSGATVTLYRAGTKVASTTTDQSGNFSFGEEPGGLYDVEISAVGYSTSRLSDQAVTPGGGAIALRIPIPRSASTSGSGLREIGRVSTSANRVALATTTVINRTVSADVAQRSGIQRFGDQLLAQPGLTSFNLDSAPGDDLNISIRGTRPSETQTLVDSDPVGPMGVFNGTGGGFNYQLSPSFALANAEITYGTGGGNLLGVDAIGGTINMQTLSPTATPQFEARQGAGTQGRQQSVFGATGTAGRLGYAAVYGVEGSYGGFAPQVITQRGLLNGDITAANVAANTWLVSGNYVLRNALGKLRYAITPNTNFQVTGYDATSWDDKTGEGDNDYITPEFAAYSVQQSGTTCALPGGGSGYQVTTDAGPACYTVDQYANTFSGPYGGTPLAYQALHLQAYNARLTSSFGPNNVIAEFFTNNYYQLYNRDNAGFTNQYRTFGERISDDFVTNRNTLGIGFFAEHQVYQSGSYGTNGGPGPVTNRPFLGSTLTNFFARDIFSLNDQFQLFANVDGKHSDVSQRTNIDPRLAIVYRPNGYDVWRISGGLGSEAPNVSLKSGSVSVTTQPGALNPNCGGVNSIGGDPNPNLSAENARELEVSYGHRFQADSLVQVVGYEEDINDVIFSNNLPLSAFGNPLDAAALAPYLARLATVCGSGASAANLGLTTATNAGSGRFQGIDLTGRWRFSRPFYADFGWDVTSARYYGIPDLALQNNFALRNGQPIAGVPFSKGTLGLDWTLKDNTELRVDNYFVGRNNALLRPPFYYASGFVAHPLGKGLLLNLGVQNIFNSEYDQYGRIGYAQFVPENQYGTDANAIQQYYSGTYGERFGLPQRSVILSLTARTK